MSSSLKGLAATDITSLRRSPDRYARSARTRYGAGWPARCGASGSFAMPSIPWHVWQATALRRPAAMSCASASTAITASAAKTAAASDAAAASGRRLIRSGLVGDAVDRAGEVVGDQHRTVLHHRDIDGTAAIRSGCGVEPAFGEHLGLVGRAVRLQGDEVD